jgi:hypothetical protein
MSAFSTTRIVFLLLLLIAMYRAAKGPVFKSFANVLYLFGIPAAAVRRPDVASVELFCGRVCRQVRELGKYRAMLFGKGERLDLVLVRLRGAAAALFVRPFHRGLGE